MGFTKILASNRVRGRVLQYLLGMLIKCAGAACRGIARPHQAVTARSVYTVTTHLVSPVSVVSCDHCSGLCVYCV